MEDNTKKYIISKYAFIKKYDNYYLLYHSLYIKKLIGDKTLFRSETSSGWQGICHVLQPEHKTFLCICLLFDQSSSI